MSSIRFGFRVWADSCIAQLGEQQLQEVTPLPLPNLSTTRVNVRFVPCECAQHVAEETVVWSAHRGQHRKVASSRSQIISCHSHNTYADRAACASCYSKVC